MVLPAIFGLTACPRPAPPPPDSPRLVLFLVVDQLRADYLSRSRPLLSGGLARLLEEGVSFDDAHHAHAVTYTAPGHASLSTGLHPSHSGIVGNVWVDHQTGEEVYCVEDERYGHSPGNLLGTTLADWIKRRYPTAKAFAVSGKDRAAVLTAGQRADGAYWYDPWSGEIESSGYYPLEDPDWLQELNGRHLPAERFGRPWEPLAVDPESAAAAGFEEIDEGLFDRSFPHALGGSILAPDGSFFSAYYRSPFVDELVAELARQVVTREELGQDPVPDFLGISFSALDTVGHNYGPRSLEVLDTLLRLDRVLGELLEWLDGQVGLEHVVVSLSADHGVSPLPEVQALHGQPGRRVGARDIACVQEAGRKLAEGLGVDPWLAEEGQLFLDRELLEEKGLDAGEVERQAAILLEACPFVERVWTGRQLAEPGGPAPSWEEQLFRNSYHPQRSPDLFFQLAEFDLDLLGQRTTHGSIWPYDTHVPMLILVPGVPPRRVSERVATVDLAPTLAELLQVAAPESLDGVSRAAWLDSGRVSRLDRRPALN